MSFADLFSALRNTSVPVKSKASKFYCFVTVTYDSLELGPDIFQFYDHGGIRAAQSQEWNKEIKDMLLTKFRIKIGSNANDLFHVHGTET